jgi:valyl-tRNA synthetase
MTTSIGNTAGNNLNFNTKTVEEYSLFLNKLWNIARFVWMHTGDIVAVDTDIVEHIQKNKKHLLPYERWILSRLHHTISTVTEGMDTYDFSSVGTDLIAFIRDDFADMAIESYKIEKENSKL